MIVGGRVTYAEVEKEKDEPATGLGINVNIKNVAVEKGVLEITYEYVVNYEKDVGTLKMRGIVLAKENTPERIVDGWKKTKKLPDTITEEVLNAINFTCSVNGTLIVRAVNLAPPMIMPKIQITKKGGKAM